MSAAGSLSVPLFGTATLNMVMILQEWVRGGFRPDQGATSDEVSPGAALQMLVDLVEADAPADHDHLGPVQQLRDLHGQGVVTLVFGSQPHFAGLLQEFLALRVNAGIQRVDGAGPG